MNGLVKVPLQFLILMIGVLVFAYYQYNQPPIFFNKLELNKIEKSPYQSELQQIKEQFNTVFQEKHRLINKLSNALDTHSDAEIDDIRKDLHSANQKTTEIREELTRLMQKNDPKADTNDNNYIFLNFVTEKLPKGLVGILIAIVFLASMGSTASALNSLASTSVIDIYKRFIHRDGSASNYLNVSRLMTLFWGIFTIIIALYANRLGNLLEAVNILGSLFYGTILGIFIVAFYMKRAKGTATFIAAIFAEILVIICWRADMMAFLWLNLVGCVSVMFFATLIQAII